MINHQETIWNIMLFSCCIFGALWLMVKPLLDGLEQDLKKKNNPNRSNESCLKKTGKNSLN